MSLTPVAPFVAIAWLWFGAVVTGGDLPRERIVYTTLRPANWELFLFEPNGAPKQLTDNPALDYDATFSPDGRWIVFCSERSGNPELYAIDLEQGGAPKPLTRGRFMEAAPAFTPDGKSVLFVSDRDGNADIFITPFQPNDAAASEKAKNLTRNASGDYRPAVSPDGKTVAFSSDRDSWLEVMNDKTRALSILCEIYLTNIDGTNVHRLTNFNAMSGSPAWSRDGKTIYFYSDRNGGAFRIWAMDADGTHPRALTPKERPAFSPAVMPNGRIAFAEKTSNGFRIASVAPDGTDIRVESGTQADCRGPAFDRHHNRMVCTGKGLLAGMLLVSNGRPFLARGAHEEVRLPDRIVEVQGVHRQFCSSSPDGREFTSGQLVSDDSSNMRLMINHLDGSNAREIFRPPNSDNVWATSWTRRANVIVFTTGPEFAPNDAVVDLWTVASDGSKPATNLTAEKFRNNAFPDLTGDGKEMVFRSTRDGNKEIYLMNSDGTNVRRITNDPADDTMPSISPNGDMIAFSSDRTSGLFQIYLQPIKDGKPDEPPRQFTHGFSPNMHSRFSPDGKWLVYASARGWLNDEYPLSNDNPQPYGEVFVAPIDGSSAPIRLTHNKWEDSIPCWGVLGTSDR
jgi:Tol biopolymer transport system component